MSSRRIGNGDGRSRLDLRGNCVRGRNAIGSWRLKCGRGNCRLDSRKTGRVAGGIRLVVRGCYSVRDSRGAIAAGESAWPVGCDAVQTHGCSVLRGDVRRLRDVVVPAWIVGAAEPAWIASDALLVSSLAPGWRRLCRRAETGQL